MADPADPAPTPTPAPSDTGDRRTRDDLRAELAAERVSRRDLENKFNQTEAQITALRSESETKLRTTVEAEVGKITVKLTKMQQRIVDAELRNEAVTLGLQDPDLLLHPLLDRTKITVNDEGEVTGVKEAFAELKTKKPDWFKPASANPNPTPRSTGNPAPAPGPGDNAPVDVRKMTKAEYAAYKEKAMRDIRATAH